VARGEAEGDKKATKDEADDQVQVVQRNVLRAKEATAAPGGVLK
jgi:hypothetical protein